MKYFALKRKDSLLFRCTALTKSSFAKKIDVAYWSWRGLQPKGTEATMDQFMSDYEKVQVIVEKLTG